MSHGLAWRGSPPAGSARIGRRVAMERVCPLVERPGRTSASLLFPRAALDWKEALSGCGLSSQACVDPKTDLYCTYWTAFLLLNKPLVCFTH